MACVKREDEIFVLLAVISLAVVLFFTFSRTLSCLIFLVWGFQNLLSLSVYCSTFSSPTPKSHPSLAPSFSLKDW